jgi:hypothetical protein
MAKANVAKTELPLDPSELGSEIASITRAAYEHAIALKHVAESTLDAVTEVFRDSNADKLAMRATRLQGTVFHGIIVLLALGTIAGRLNGAAWVRCATSYDDVLED